jgi:hypothetical protein
MQLPTDWPGLFAAAGFQLGTVRDIQAQTLPTWQHVQAVYRQHAAQIRVRYGRRLGPGIARRIDRQVAQVAAAIRRCDQTLRQLPGAERDSAQHAAGVPPGCASVSTDPGREPRAAPPARPRRDSSHGLNVHVVGVVVILAGVVGLLLSLLVRGPLSPPRLSLRIRPGSPDEPGRAVIKEAAAADVAAVLEDDRYFVPDAPGGGEGDF